MYGIDEAGRGALAGPVVVACVGGLPDAEWVSGLRDSKRMTPRRREVMFDHITADAAWVRTATVDAPTVDAKNVLRANLDAMGSLADAVLQHDPRASVVVDGDQWPTGHGPGGRVACVVKADASVREAMAAGIVAKVTRDRVMAAYPDERFSFAAHKGYGTARHYQELQAHGAIPGFHRRSFNLRLPLSASDLPFVG